MVKTVDVTTTSTLRPDILDKTYNSFFNRCFSKNNIDYKLIINIDPIGDKRYTQNDVLNVAKKYFKNIDYNLPSYPSFVGAVKWCWSRVESDFVFHLEDDWILNEDIDILKLIDIMKKYNNLAMIRFFKGSMAHGMKPIENSFIKSEDINTISLIQKRCCLNPGLFAKKYIKEASAIMVGSLNPESQLCLNCSGSERIDNFINKWEYSVYGYGRKVVSDTGVKWRKDNRISKKPDFTKWEISR